MRRTEQVPWPVAIIIATLLLCVIDICLSFWHPRPLRLPEQYSTAYLQLITEPWQHMPPTTVILGDSVLWGYRISEPDTMVAHLHVVMPQLNTENLSFEGGSLPNSAIMLRYLQMRKYAIHAVIFNINPKQFNAADSAYSTLHPALGRAAQFILTSTDRALLNSKTTVDHRTYLEQQIESFWRLYRLRVDLREALFHSDDAATLLAEVTHHWTGQANREATANRPTIDRYEGSYDLSALTPENAGVIYYRKMIDDLCATHIPALGFLSPTNHALLHEFIDVPEYDANLYYVLKMPHCATVAIINLDRAIPGNEFIDNDHLTPTGQKHLANILLPQLQRLTK